MASEVERIEGLFTEATSCARPFELELYHRSARSVRVTRRAGQAPGRVHGAEEGMAVRLRPAGVVQAAFAACNGSGPDRAAWIVREASRDEPGSSHHPGQWAAGGSGSLRDVDSIDPTEPADAARLEAWIDDAWEWLLQSPSGRTHARPIEAWIEVASIEESWAADGGLRAFRRRCRGWSVVRTQGVDSGRPPVRPIVVAERDWTRLDPCGWRRIVEDRWMTGNPPASLPEGPTLLLFNPESSAGLVKGLVETLALAGGSNRPVGPGWDLEDDPLDSTALFGGTFDDAGFVTRTTRLADGRRWIGGIDGPGHFRRGSFREPPAFRSSHLVVRPREDKPPANGILVSSVTLHPVEPDRWVLELEGALLDGGRPVAPLPPAFVGGSPADWVQRCVASVGPPRQSHLGVRTPALVFEVPEVQTCG